jgi:hypothetical protein
MVTPAMIRTQVQFEMKALSDLIGKDVKINQIMALLSSPAATMLTPQSQDYYMKQLAELLGFDQNQTNVNNAGLPPMVPGGQMPLPGMSPIGGVAPQPVPINPAGAPPPLAVPPMLAGPAAGTTPASLGVHARNLPLGTR